MAHNHETCPLYGCQEGMLYGPCGDECPNEDCMIVGHCDCKCHSNRECGCGYHWDRMEKKSA